MSDNQPRLTRRQIRRELADRERADVQQAAETAQQAVNEQLDKK